MFDAKSLLNMIMGAGQQGAQGGQQGGPGQNDLGSMIGNVLGGLQGKAQDAAQGAQNMAGGMGNDLNDAVAKAKEAIQSGNYAGLAEQAKGFLQGNAGGIALGGIAGLVLGTGAGRSILGSAAKLGGVALVGGLAYKAYQNYQEGKPLASFGEPVLAAPAGSGFAEGDGDDNAKALLMVRAMIAAAAADGEIDDTERARIMGNLKQAGLDDEASGFLDEEFANPLDVNGLVQMSSTPEMAAQIYTAARLAVDPDTDDEQTFLADLASGLSLDSELTAHIDAAAASVMQSQPV